MIIFYRLSDAGYKKIKHPLINNKNCLENFKRNFLNNKLNNFFILVDRVCDETYKMVQDIVSADTIISSNLGSSAQTFNRVLDLALKQKNDDEIIYFVENDYIHRKNSKSIMEEGFDIGTDYISLYDHPDKYLNGDKGGNPFIENGGEITKVFLSKSCHWKLTNSTTMTFAAKLKTLREDEPILRKWTVGSYPEDFRMFLKLRDKGRTLITPIPSYSTHGDLPWLAPLINWDNEIL
jgi:hypothetical protein